MKAIRYFYWLFFLISAVVFSEILENRIGAWPFGRRTDLSGASVDVSAKSLQIVIPFSVPENRILSLDYPQRIRIGDSDVIRLTLDMDNDGKLLTSVADGEEMSKGEIITSKNLYDTYNVFAEARLDMAGVNTRPSNTISETLLPGQKITFFWSVLPEDVGSYKGTVWFYLRFLPKSGGEEIRQALSAQSIVLEVTSFFGLSGSSTRWLGVISLVISILLGIPFIKAWIERNRIKLRG